MQRKAQEFTQPELRIHKRRRHQKKTVELGAESLEVEIEGRTRDESKEGESPSKRAEIKETK